jgi:hypothetical protein
VMSLMLQGIGKEKMVCSWGKSLSYVWCCDPVECIQDLIGNPALHEHLAYQPECVYADSQRTNCIIDKMWTTDWWWNTQASVELYISPWQHGIYMEFDNRESYQQTQWLPPSFLPQIRPSWPDFKAIKWHGQFILPLGTSPKRNTVRFVQSVGSKSFPP